MKRKELEMALQRVPPFPDPDPSLEQYPTPAAVAADMVFSAYANGDVEGMKVVDLGCGPGILSIGAWLMGAGEVVGFDRSESALSVAKAYAESVGAPVDYRLSDVSDVSEGADTVIMNPPFGSQRRNADRPFLEKAMECAERVYSVHMAETLDFVDAFARERGRRIVRSKEYDYSIPHTFAFHTKARRSVRIAAVLIARARS